MPAVPSTRCAALGRYEFFADDLPIWGFVGPPPEQTKGDNNIYIYTHKSLDIAYNGNRVSGACLEQQHPAGARTKSLTGGSGESGMCGWD